ncbi:MOSC domain-containing protein [Rhodobacteraceae bacterium F11138]|nr:MOSC domain-containing protein [Rhodobacteraceae bacterium F11138]
MTFTGKVEGLHVTPRSFLPMRNMEKLQLIEGLGVEGDRHSINEAFHSDRPEEGRQITFFEAETLEALKRDHHIILKPEQHRRNVTTRGVPLNHLVGRRFRVGTCVVEATRLTTPCRHIEQITGLEIYEVLLHRAGLNAKIVKGGEIHLGDIIEPE